MSASQAPRTYAVCVYCKLRRVDRSVFYVDPYFPAAGVNYRCLDLDACGERRRAREVAAAERRQAKREAAERQNQSEQCTAETATRYCVLDAGHSGPHVDGIATWNDQPSETNAERYRREHDAMGPEHANWCAGPGTHAPASQPELLDMRYGPVDHACRGCWQHRGRNRGGHDVYRCDSGRHIVIDAHAVASHICNPVACEYPTEWALQP